MVTVLVAVYNGEKYLSELLNSLVNQTYKDIKIVVSDDNSSDSSAEIIKTFFEKYPNIIEPIFNKIPYKSAKAHFISLLERFSDSEYVMLCDQDDVWFSDKIEKTLTAMKEGENNKPRLVHTDCMLTDEGLNVTHKSFKSFSLIPKELPFSKLIAENTVQGASVMINRELIKYAVPYNSKIVMHDGWLGLIAAALGEIVYIDEPTFYYRQHGSNEIGAEKKPTSISYIFNRLFTDIKESINRSRRQAGLLCERLGEEMPKEYFMAAKLFSESEKLTKLKRLQILRKQKIIPNTFLKRIKFLLWG